MLRLRGRPRRPTNGKDGDDHVCVGGRGVGGGHSLDVAHAVRVRWCRELAAHVRVDLDLEVELEQGSVRLVMIVAYPLLLRVFLPHLWVTADLEGRGVRRSGWFWVG